MSKLLNFQKFFSNCILEEDSKMQEIGEWSLENDGKMLTFLKQSWIFFEIKIKSTLYESGEMIFSKSISF